MAHIFNTAVVFAVVLGVLVVVHELGHYWMAKRVGMKVHEFAFGFGPRIAGLFKRGDTQFNVRAIPLGGFVSIAGMDPNEENMEGGFNSKPISARALVILAGPVMSLLLGYVVFLLIGFVWGFPTDRTLVAQVEPNSPAQRSGLCKGDVIYGLNGKHLDTEQLVKAIHESPEKEAVLLVQRNGKEITIKATPELKPNPILEQVTPEKRAELLRDPEFNRNVGLLGFKPASQLERTSVIMSIMKGTIQSYEAARAIILTFASWSKVKEGVGGIVAIAYVTNDMVKAGTRAVFVELALLSVMLGILNLVPWPVLDGGHILYLIIEKIRGKKMRAENWYAIQLAGMGVLIFLAILLVYVDISRIAGGKFF